MLLGVTSLRSEFFRLIFGTLTVTGSRARFCIVRCVVPLCVAVRVKLDLTDGVAGSKSNFLILKVFSI